jgi:hypothetical protein
MEPSGSFSPPRSQPLHSQTEQVVNEEGRPARVIVTWSVSCEPQDGHSGFFVMAHEFSTCDHMLGHSPEARFFGRPP